MTLFAPVEPPPPTIDADRVRRAIELALRLGDAGAAWRAAHALLRCCPEAITPLVLLGRALLEAGNAPVSVDYFRRALKLNPLDAVAWGALAGALSRGGQAAAADAALRRAALHDPLGSESLAPGIAESLQPIGLGVVYLRRGHAELAAADLAAALERHPRRVDLRVYYVEALRRCGETAAARRQLALIDPAQREELPVLLLRAALEERPAALRSRCASLDPDGHLTRRFFAPEPAPWELPAAPALDWSEELEPIASYLPLLSSQKAATAHRAPSGSERVVGGPAGEPARPPAPSGELAGFLTAAERLRHRLADVGAAPRPLVPWAEGQALDHVILSSRGALQRRFGADGFAAVDRRLHDYAAALRRRGLGAHVAYCDDAASLRIAEHIAVAPSLGDATALRELLRSLSGALGDAGRELGVVTLVGGDEVVPFHRLPNPIPDDDVVVLSDNPYASDDPGYLVPQRIVARLPEGAGAHPDQLLALLDALIAYHRGVGPRPGARPGTARAGRGRKGAAPTLAAGYCAEIWQEPSRAALDALAPGAPLLACPPLDAAELDLRALAGRGVLYLNLHGAQGLPNFYGQPDSPWVGPATRLPIALRPDQIDAQLVGGTLLVSEACYGAELAGRSAGSSIPLQALASGALAFVGATVNAYGSMAAPLIGADLLFQRMLAALGRGAPIGQALHQARIEFAQEMYRRQGCLDDVDLKTLVEFVLLGDPWAAAGPPAEPPVPWRAGRVAAIERMPKPRPKAVLDEREVPGDLVARARGVLRRILPGATALPLRITAQPNPRRQRKSDPERELTFSARESRPTADGHYLPQAAHVTVSGQAVVKVAMTR